MSARGRRAMTLLEMLLAITLLGVVAAAGWTWSLSIQRSSAAIRATELAEQDALACLRLLRDDLLGSIAGGERRYQIVNEQELNLLTLNAVPGSAAVGARPVQWTWDAANGLRRRDGDQMRTLSRRVAVRFHAGDGDSLWSDWLAVEPHAIPAVIPTAHPAMSTAPAVAPIPGVLLWSLPVDCP
jgi:prepilin-type N-terminal cleavage/methylation domain-containing protein